MDLLGSSNHFLLESFVEVVVEWLGNEMQEAWGLLAARQGLPQAVGRCSLGAAASTGAGAGRALQALAGATAAR